METRRDTVPSGRGDDLEPLRPSVEDDGSSSYRFTFRAGSTNSSKGSIIEPDPSIGDENGYEEDFDSSQSLSDSVQTFPEEFGRTYHAYRAGSYNYPNDFPEQERLSLQYEALTRLFGGKLFFAPLTKSTPPRRILDIATGTGEWAIQIGDYFPEAEVTATDLSPIQPLDVPPNVNFYVEDSGDPWDYTNDFDYIHSRVTAGCWHSFKEQIAQQAFENLTPGGWFESQEYDSAVYCDDGTMDPNGPLSRWFRDLADAAAVVDRPVIICPELKKTYEEVGFVDIHEKLFKIPLNGWPKDENLKELGRMWERNFQSGLSGFSLNLFNRAFSLTAAQTEVALVDVRRELSDPRIHSYHLIWVVWGRKPFPGEVNRPTSFSPA